MERGVQTMKMVKTPKKPVLTFYLIMLAVLLLFNLLVVPSVLDSRITEVDYGTFLKHLDAKEVHLVQVEEDYIHYIMGTEAEPQIFRTATFNDDSLVDRLYASGCAFGQVKAEEPNPIISFLISWILPIALSAACPDRSPGCGRSPSCQSRQ